MSNKKKILLAVDDTETAEHAFEWYSKCLHQPDNEVLVVHSLEAPDIQVYPFMGLRDQFLLEAYKKEEEKEKVVKGFYEVKLAEKQFSGRYMVKVGKAGPTLVKTAKEENVDFIVIGTRGLGTIARAFLTSVSHYVLHHAHCPVVVVQHDKEKA